MSYQTPDDANTSREWRPASSRPPERQRVSPRGEKTLLTVWWDWRGVISLDFGKKSDNITFDNEYYRGLIEQMRKELGRRRRNVIMRGPKLWIDNAPIHNSASVEACISRSGFERSKMPPYSLDIAPSDYYLFRNLKTGLRNRRGKKRVAARFL